jgi:transposase
MKKQRKHYTPEEKVAVLRRNLLDKEPISKLCDELGLQPTVFYRWQKEFFESGAAAFEQKRPANHSAEQERIAYLAKKIQIQGRGPRRTDGGARRAKKKRLSAPAAATAVYIDLARPSATAASIKVSYIALRRKVRRVPGFVPPLRVVAAAPLVPSHSKVGARC